MSSSTGSTADILAAHWAQQAAYANWAAVAVGVASLIVSVVAVVLVRGQLKLSREAIEDATRSADAASEAASVARAGTRAWIRIEVSNIVAVYEDEDQPRIVMDVTAINVGNLPALNVNCRAIDRDKTDLRQLLEQDLGKGFGQTVFPERKSIPVGLNLEIAELSSNRPIKVAIGATYRLPGASDLKRTVVLGHILLVLQDRDSGSLAGQFYPDFVHTSDAQLIT